MAKQLKGATADETHSAILDLIRSSGVVSRIELADRSGLTGASISRIVKQLLADGLIVETGLGDPTGGKRPPCCSSTRAPGTPSGISIDIAEHHLRGHGHERPGDRAVAAKGIGRDTPATVIKRIAAELEDLLVKTRASSPRRSWGSAIAWPADRTAASLLRANTADHDWESFDIATP